MPPLIVLRVSPSFGSAMQARLISERGDRRRSLGRWGNLRCRWACAEAQVAEVPALQHRPVLGAAADAVRDVPDARPNQLGLLPPALQRPPELAVRTGPGQQRFGQSHGVVLIRGLLKGCQFRLTPRYHG